MSQGIDEALEARDLYIALIAFMPMSSRRDLTDSATKLYDKVRHKNPLNEFQNTLRMSSGKCPRCFTSFELKKPGIVSKNFSSASSSPRASIDQRKMRRSNFHD